MISRLKRYWWLFVIWIFSLLERWKLVYNTQSYYDWITRLGLLNSNGSPKVCLMCGNTTHKETVKDRINGTECEIEFRCSRCNNQTGYWAYGSFEF